jgi:hypothetical protein
MARDNMNDVKAGVFLQILYARRHKIVILMVVNDGKMRTKGEQRRRK